MILLTGATGAVGSALRRRLTASDLSVRCLVRDPRRLGPDRVRVQIALGNLAEPGSFRHALRGVDTVVHLAASVRDQPGISVEELNGVATLRLIRAAERAGASRFVWLSALGATLHSASRFLRAKALAERAVESAALPSVVLAASLVYAPGDRLMTVLERLSYLPVLPLAGSAEAHCQPIWAEDVADCLMRVLSGDPLKGPGQPVEQPRRLELAGPETLSYRALVRTALRSFGRRRRVAAMPPALSRRALRALERASGPAPVVTWEEAELLNAPMVTPRGSADAEALGVRPLRLRSVLGTG